jgi:hypothetical protein
VSDAAEVRAMADLVAALHTLCNRAPSTDMIATASFRTHAEAHALLEAARRANLVQYGKAGSLWYADPNRDGRGEPVSPL